jgi:hypothetical protein
VQGIICGAHNFVEGDKVVVTLPGAVLPGDFHISARKTYGHLSAGMIASVRELGIGEDHDGILVLSRIGLDPEIGTDAMELLGLYDQAAEINVTPDRGYAFSLRGVAREYAHATGTEFTDPASKVNAPAVLSGGYGVKINDDAPIYGKPGCDRFVARTVRGVDATRPTPPWMSSRLRLAGIRSISLPVDISNYVMLELGQPLHCYDLDKLSGDIVVRRAVAGEKMTTLDGKERSLDPEDLLITDASGPIGIAGVMGGAATEVADTTPTSCADRSRALRRGVHRPLAPPPQAPVGSVQALRTRRGLAGGRHRRPARGRPPRGTRRRHGRRGGNRRRNRPGLRDDRPARQALPPPGSASTSPKSRSSRPLRTSVLSSRKDRRRLERHCPELAQ